MRRKALIGYAVSAVLGAAMFMLVIYLGGYSAALESSDKYRIAADAFTLPAILFLAVSALAYISREGAFDMISYALGRAVRMLIPFSRKSNESFYEYRERRRALRRSGYSFITVIGLVFLVGAAICIALFYSSV